MKNRSERISGIADWSVPVLLGLAISSLQLWFCILASGHDSFTGAYLGFALWDGQWYEHISQWGYVSSIPPIRWNRDVANVAFFPGFPIWTWLITKVTSLSPRAAMVVGAQLMASVFWILFIALVRRWTSSKTAVLLAALFVLSHPAAFYLQVGYSESLFLASLLGFLFLTTRENFFWPAAASVGIVMTSTRIVGAPLVLLCAVSPALGMLSSTRREEAKRILVKHSAVSLLSLIGVTAFFAYCWFKWNRWDLYMWTQQIGWDLRPNYWAIFQLKNWTHWSLNSWWPFRVEPNRLSQLFTSLYLVILTATAALEGIAYARGIRGLEKRLPFYASSILMMYISVSGLSSINLISMVRYTFPVHVCWMIGFIGLYTAWARQHRLARYGLVGIGLLVSVYTFILQVRFLTLFTHFQWVA